MKQVIKNYLARRMVQKKKADEPDIVVLEQKHENLLQQNFNDSIYFTGLSENGFSFVTRQAFRTGKPAENWLKIEIPGEGVWGFQDMKLKTGEGFRQGDLIYSCPEPGEIWNIAYDGPVFQGDKKQEIHLRLEWDSDLPVADFNQVGTTPERVAQQIAKEKWNKTFFQKLKEIHKVHYEQAGHFHGIITWKGKEQLVFLKGFRDHSFGIRHWDDWERHLWLLGRLDDGTFFNISIISYTFIKELTAGFCWDGRRYLTIKQIPSFDEVGFVTPLPEKLQFTVRHPDGHRIPVTVEMKTFFPFVMDNVYFIRQAKAIITWEGKKGIGLAEMGVKQ